MKQLRITFIPLLAVLVSACGGNTDVTQNKNSNPGASGGEQIAAAENVHPGAETYQNYCFSCHTPGLSGAPKLGDADAWAVRIAKGNDLLLQATIEGVPPAMPARGMCFSCTDQELADAVAYLVENSQ